MTKSTDAGGDMLNVAQLAQELGVSLRTALRRVQDGKIPATKLAGGTGAWVIRRQDLPSTDVEDQVEEDAAATDDEDDDLSRQSVGGIPQWTMGDRLRKAREAAGYTQRELADRIGIAHRTVTSCEKGQHRVRKIVLNAWAMTTGVPVVWLETGDQGPATATTPAPSSLRGRRPAPPGTARD